MKSGAGKDVKPETHFGPIYGRPHSSSIALCRPTGGVNTMSRSLHLVTCRDCLRMVERRIDDSADWARDAHP